MGLAGASASSWERFVQRQRVSGGQLMGRVGLGSARSMPVPMGAVDQVTTSL